MRETFSSILTEEGRLGQEVETVYVVFLLLLFHLNEGNLYLQVAAIAAFLSRCFWLYGSLLRVDSSWLSDCGRFCVIWGVLWSPHPGLLVSPHSAAYWRGPPSQGYPARSRNQRIEGRVRPLSGSRHLLLWLSLFTHKQFLPQPSSSR